MLIALLTQFNFKSCLLNVNSPIITRIQQTIKHPIILIIKHKFCPDTNEIQSFKFSVSYCKLTIVLIIPKTKIGIIKIVKIKTM